MTANANDIVIFDLDGTLALIDHRRHFVERSPKRWREFNAACADDTVNLPVARMFAILREAGYAAWIVSGRSNEVKAKTIVWLKKNALRPDRLIMRPAGDHRPDDKLKRSWLHDGTIPKERVFAVYDDRSSVVEMWRDEGLPCFQVAAGNF